MRVSNFIRILHLIIPTWVTTTECREWKKNYHHAVIRQTLAAHICCLWGERKRRRTVEHSNSSSSSFSLFFLFADFRGGGGEIFFIFSRQIALLRAGRNLIWREGKIQLHGISLGRHKRERMIIIRHPRSLKGRCHCRRKFYEKRQSFFKIKSISWKLRCLLWMTIFVFL